MTNIDPVKDYTITDHGKFELEQRGISEEVLATLLKNPGQRMSVRQGREVFQNIIDVYGKKYLIRIFVDIDRNPIEVVTGYKTSKIEKYWEEKS